jgi:formate-dependent nitrite reductase membrane component NrfD
MPQHFVTPPDWHWYIVWYFFLGGIAGGAYALGTLLRLVGDPQDEGAARTAFLVAFPTFAICPILLTLDLGRPLRFWHMLFDARTGLPTFKYWSPMSVGAWVLFVFGLFATLSFIEALVLDGRLQHPLARRVADGLAGGFGRLFMIIGACLGLFIAGYTGVLLAVSNQPIWSDTWALGGLFLASGLSTAAAAIVLFAWWRRDARLSQQKLSVADRYFLVLELVLLAIFFMTLGPVAPQVFHGGWILLWVVVLVGILIPLVLHRTAGTMPILASLLVLIGSFALRAVIIMSPQL